MRTLVRFLRPAPLAALAALLGCAPGGAQLHRELADGTRPGGVVELPFVKQRPERCGSAALAEVLAFWQAPDAAEDQLAAEVYSAKLHGSLNLDLAGAAARRGLVVRARRSSLIELRRAAAGGCPAIVLITLSPHLLGRRHYLTVKGADLGEGYLLADDGSAPDRVLRPRPFAGDWKSAGNWALYCWPPERPPPWASAVELLRGGVILERGGRLKAAAESYARALESDAGLWEARFNLGNVALAAGRPADAEAAYRQALSLRPDEPDVLNNLAWTLLKSGGKPAEAAELARKALGGLGSPPPPAAAARVRHTLGLALAKLGRADEARAMLEAALAAARLAGDRDAAAEIEADLMNDGRR